MLNLNSPATARQFENADVVLAVGTDVFASFLYVDVPFLKPGTRLIHLDSNYWEIEKSYPTEVGILADPAAGMADLAESLDASISGGQREAAATRAATLAAARQRDAERYQERIKPTWDNRPMPVERMMHELAAAVPPDTIIADEAVTSRPAVNRAFDFDKPGDIYGIRGGALGWAMPGALGVQLAHPDRPVLAVVGDGASMYTVQALWTASRYNIPVGVRHLQQPGLPHPEGEHGGVPAGYAGRPGAGQRLRGHGLRQPPGPGDDGAGHGGARRAGG